MRDRAFGVEIECGYDGDGGSSECYCECYCYEYECWFCRYGCECGNSLEPTDEDYLADCECECTCERCGFCEYGCDGGCDDGYDSSYGCDVAADLLRDNGFGTWCQDIHPDGSGVEIPSPILRGREGLRELQQVMELLRSNGFNTTRSDGMHVHHDAPEWVNDEALTAHTIELWEENLPLIRRFVDPSRTLNTMCSSYADTRYDWDKRAWEEFKQTKKIDGLREKFRALNICHLQRTGSLEIRLHEGTLDFQKAAAWIRFGQGFLDFALKTHKRGSLVTCESRTALLRQVRASSTTRRRLMAVERSVA